MTVQSLKECYLGPQVPKTIDRRCLPFTQDIAPSYIPNILLSRALERGRPVEELAVKHRVTCELLLNLEDDFENHMENRIHLFLQQMLVIYKTGLCFDTYKRADIQVGSVPSKGRESPTYVAAHSGTLPTLRLQSLKSSETSVSFAQNTSLYFGWNTTVYLPEVVNHVDSALDKSTLFDTTLRDRAVLILNRVSAGKISPKEGLRNFLTFLTQMLEMLRTATDSQERKIIINAYAIVVEHYCNRMDEEDSFMQKLFFRPLEERVNEQFYLAVQAQIHEKLKTELEQLKQETVEIPQVPKEMHLQQVHALIKTKDNAIVQKTKTITDYCKLCTQVDTVRAAAIRYFMSLHALTPSQREEDLNKILQVKTAQTVGKIGLSRDARALHDSTHSHIKKTQGKEPRNMHAILFAILREIGQTLSST